MIFDTWGGVLADGAFQRFSLAYMRQVLGRLQREHEGERIPVIVFTKGGGPWLEEIAAIGADAVGLDWTVNLGQARARIGARCALQGNLDPMALFGGEDALRGEVAKVLRSFGDPRNADGTWAGHVFNLGHGISQFTPPEAVAVLVDAVHQQSRKLRL
jgi:uroporphyrinogen decarboxylase